MPEYELQEDPNSNAVGRQEGSIALQDHIRAVRTEIDEFFADMRRFNEMEPDEVLQKLSSFVARAGELRSRLVRSGSNRMQALRTQEIEPFLELCDTQFKIHSRLIAVRQQDLDLVRGQT